MSSVAGIKTKAAINNIRVGSCYRPVCSINDVLGIIGKAVTTDKCRLWGHTAVNGVATSRYSGGLRGVSQIGGVRLIASTIGSGQVWIAESRRRARES